MKSLAAVLAISVLMSLNVSAKSDKPKADPHAHAHEEDGHGEKDHAAEDKDDHDHDHEEKSSGEKHDHAAEAKGGEAKHEQGEEEENSNIGPEKGITEFSEEQGFKLSPEAVKNFELKSLKLSKGSTWQVPASAVLNSGEEVNIFRIRNGYYKRVDFIVDKKTPQDLTIRSKDLKEGDEIAIQGIGFLRTAEIVATGGAPEGHSH
jgi:hypothetical protein